MPFEVFNGPVIIRLEHDGTETGSYTDVFGTFPSHTVFRIHYVNNTGDTWEIEVEPVDPDTAQPYNFTVAPFASGDNGQIPPPQRFQDQPMVIKRSKV